MKKRKKTWQDVLRKGERLVSKAHRMHAEELAAMRPERRAYVMWLEDEKTRDALLDVLIHDWIGS